MLFLAVVEMTVRMGLCKKHLELERWRIILVKIINNDWQDLIYKIQIDKNYINLNLLIYFALMNTEIYFNTNKRNFFSSV